MRTPAKAPERVLHDPQPRHRLVDLIKCTVRARVDAARKQPPDRAHVRVLVALERGTPLADVVRAQAQDVRELSKRELMETAGRKEVHMMVPLVFGILPLTVLFAVFPGIALLDIGI